MLFRLIYYLLVGYIIWKVVQFVARLLTPSPRMRRPDRPPPEKRADKPAETQFRDIQEAKFEDITPDKNPNQG